MSRKGQALMRSIPASPPANPTAGLLTLREGAKYLNVPLATLQYWVYRARLLPSYRLGVGRGKRMVKRADLDAFVNRGSIPAATDRRYWRSA